MNTTTIKCTEAHFARKLYRLLLLALSLALPLVSQAAPFGSAFTYQGRLNFSGTPAADGFYDFRFTLHDAATLGAPIGSAMSVNAVPVTNGLFTAQLDFGAPAFTSGEARWLQLQVNTNGVTPLASLNPRQRLAPTPQAIYAGNAGTASAVAPGAVTTVGLAPDAVDGEVIFDGSIGAADLAPSLLNGTFWRLTGNTGAGNFLGSVDNQPVEIRANNQAALRLVPYAASPSVVGGHSANTVNVGIEGAFIGGGGQADSRNLVSGRYGVLVGGHGNQVHGIGAFVGGGTSNYVEQVGSFVGGGSRNSALRPYATVAGGSYNLAAETNGTIGGGSGNSLGGNFGYSTISGGLNNHVGLAQAGTIGGGIQHHIRGNSHTATIGGGYQNFIETNGTGGTIAGGNFNLLTERYASIGGGSFNTAHGQYSTIGGGFRNLVIARSASVGGGQSNVATAVNATVGGGQFNRAEGIGSSIAGGINNIVEAGSAVATIAGGDLNGIGVNATHSAIGGGGNNRIDAESTGTVIGGGLGNQVGAFSFRSIIAGGEDNRIGPGTEHFDGAHFNTISGGRDNEIFSYSQFGVIGGGSDNYIAGTPYGTISGGLGNTNSGDYAAIPGGLRNLASGAFSLAAGRRAKAVHSGSFVWADDTDVNFASTTNKQFAVRANNGVMIQSSATALDLRGGGALRVAGAGVNTATPIFTHRATVPNTSGAETRISHPHCDGKPGAILIVTYNFNPSGLAGTRNDRPVGIYYTGTQWAIYNLDGTAMPVGAAYNVLVANP